jgi:transposase
VARRGRVATEPEAIAGFLAEAEGRGLAVARMVHESGQLAIWLDRALKARGLPVVCIDARRASKVLSARLNKSDRADAEGLAQLARTGWFAEVHVRSEPAERLRALLGARELLMRQRVQLEGHARGVLKTFGVRLGKVAPGGERAGFRARLAAAAEGDPVLELVAETLIQAHATLAAAEAALAEELNAIARTSPLARRLMTVPSVGPLVALSFIAAIDDVGRFTSSADVGAYFGLTPPRRQSGEVDYSGRISRCGEARLRCLLYESATCLILRVQRFSPLKAWAMRLVERIGFRKAVVAVARKLAVILFALWRDGTTFRWTREAQA